MTLIEVLTVVAVAGIVFSAVASSVQGIQRQLTEDKLVRDVETINRAVRAFEASGGNMGWLELNQSPSWILGQLKGKVNDSDRTVGLSGRLIDPRLKAQLMWSEEEVDSDAPRAVWDAAEQEFVVITDNSIDGWKISGFELSDEGGDFIESLAMQFADQRKDAAYEYAGESGWVWDYDGDAVPGARPGPTLVALNLGSGTPTAPGLPAGVSRLLAPTFSFAAGTYPLTDFPMLLELGNPNDAAISEIWYSTSLGNWEHYDGTPIPMLPGNSIQAFARSSDTEHWADSYYSHSAYEASPVELELAVTGPAAMNWAEAGGAVEPGGPVVGLAGDGLITLANAGAIPDGFESSSNFQVYWTVDGSDPASSGTAMAGGPFSGGFGGETVETGIAVWGSGSSLPIQVVAKSLNEDLFHTSEVVNHTVSIAPITLRAPTVEFDTGQATISLDPTFGDLPVGARIYYTIDGTDPGESGGEATTGMLYTGPFAVDFTGPVPVGECTNEVVVTARVYGPSGFTHWFDVSGTDSEVATGGVPEPGTFAALVCLSKSLCEYAWLNMGGSAVLNGSPTHVDGDVAVGPGGTFNPGSGSVSGDIIVHDEGDADLTQPIADAMAMAIGLADLAPTQTFGTISNNTTISATAADGVNIINVEGINLTGHKKLTISGGSDDWFIVNVSSTFNLAGQAEILTSGSVDPSKVIFNVGPGVPELKVTGGGTVFPGTILAPETNLHIAGGSTIEGSVIAGGSSQMLAGGSAILGAHHFGGCE